MVSEDVVRRCRECEADAAPETRLCRRENLWFNTVTVMASVVIPLDQPSNYKDSQARVDRQKQHDLLHKSTTLYVRLCPIIVIAHKRMNPTYR